MGVSYYNTIVLGLGHRPLHRSPPPPRLPHKQAAEFSTDGSGKGLGIETRGGVKPNVMSIRGGEKTHERSPVAMAVMEQESKYRAAAAGGGGARGGASIHQGGMTRGIWESPSVRAGQPSGGSPLPGQHDTDGLCQDLARLGNAGGGGEEFDRTSMRQARQTATRRASAPFRRPVDAAGRVGQQQQQQSPQFSGVRFGSGDAVGGGRLAKATASVALATAAAAAAAAAEGRGYSPPQHPNCAVPSSGRGSLGAAWDNPAGAGYLPAKITQGDLLRQQRARGRGVGGQMRR